MTQKSKGLIKVRDNLFNTYQEELELPTDVLDRTDELLDEAVQANQTQNRCYKTIIAALTMLSCRENDVPRVADHFANVTMKDGPPITRNKIHNEFRRLRQEFNITVPPINSSIHLDYYADKLNVTDETRELAHEYLNTAEEIGLDNGPAPTTLAAGALDAARRLTNEEILQNDITDVSHVSSNQFRNYCHQLMEQTQA